MDRRRFEFNPQRDQLLESLLRLRKTYPDSFPDKWAESGTFFKNLSTWKPDLDAGGPELALEMVCMAHRFWLMQAVALPPTLSFMGRWVKGMLLVDMDRLGERPPSISELMGIEIDDDEEGDER